MVDKSDHALVDHYVDLIKNNYCRGDQTTIALLKIGSLYIITVDRDDEPKVLATTDNEHQANFLFGCFVAEQYKIDLEESHA